MEISLIILTSYLLGSIPFGFLLTKIILKKDIREIGSGNIGATNALRTGNKLIGYSTLILDVLKAVIPVLYVKNNFPDAVYISALLALGDVAHGEKVFKKCKACHSIKQGGGNKIGPKLWNVMFRPVGAITEYKYSKALSSYGKEWSWEEMNGFLIKPSSWIKGNKMGFAGLKSEKDRASVILYLNQNGENPKPLP